MATERVGSGAGLARRPEELASWLMQDSLRAALVRFIAQRSEPVYLVGGSVRDALLGRDTMDLDFAVDGSAIALARAVADRFGGALVVMDAERDVARIVVGHGEGAQHWDLAGLRAPTIEADLQARDVTVNALALALRSPCSLLDPTGGLADLQRGVLRSASEEAFTEDPVRVLRLARFRGELGFAVMPTTRRLARAAAKLLPECSSERVRDELYAILRLPAATAVFQYLCRLRALGHALYVVPRLDEAALDAGLRRLRVLERWASGWCPGARLEIAEPAMRSVARALAECWQSVLAGGRTRWQAVKLAALLVALDPDDAAAACATLRLSNVEVRWVSRAVAAAQELPDGLEGGSDLAFYRYYRRYGEPGVDGAVLVLAGEDAGCAALALRAWFERHEQVVAPPRLVTGRDVMRILGVGSGPAIGSALEAVREAQVAGELASREEALRWLKRRALARD